ncbi:MAG: hypothetical protein IPM16_18845 [Chloroflexi bacterium]|nr:hypothetical protein [Chloroflexota bacterium]
MPQTAEYLYLGVAVVILVMGGLVFSMWTRLRSAERALHELDADGN